MKQMPIGFDFFDDRNNSYRKIYFIEPKGKDVSFPRWRICLYYAAGFALTYFAGSEHEYDKFIEKNAAHCFSDYEEFKQCWWTNALKVTA